MKPIAQFFGIVVVLGVLVFPIQKGATAPYDSVGLRLMDFLTGGKASLKSGKSLFGTAGDLVLFTIQRDSTVGGTIEATGILKGGYFFEGNAVGSLLDANKNVLKTFPITATGEWMTIDGVPFEMSVDASDVFPGKGFIRISNDNPSGDPANDKHIDVPVVFE
ncbi:MAG: hypothetical protein KBC17_03780 [Candidatus Pacebacteria bacterium]|nr:hypothetical protein [Candidatus Paceibacterota bacterium]